MATKTPAQVAQDYLTHLSSLKPDVDISLSDSDWWVKGQAIGGAVAGLYGDQKLLSNDPFPQTARVDAVTKHLSTYFQTPFNNYTPAQASSGYMSVTGTAGTVITIGMQAIYQPNGNTYTALSGFTMPATSALVPMTSVGTGQSQNLLSGASLFIPSPPAGLNANGSASGNFSNGRDQESPQAAAQRILNYIQSPPAGGNAADYELWAEQASPLVTSANVLRFPAGFGTVGVVISAGTVDIDTAINNGQPIVVSPSQDVINSVQNYINAINPITDCATVIGPTTLPINVSVTAYFSQGNGSTILPGQTFTQTQLVQNEVMRAIYKTGPGGRQIRGVGYVVLSDIEEQIDQALSNEPFQVGSNPILIDRQVAALSATGPNLQILGTQVPIPGTITVVSA